VKTALLSDAHGNALALRTVADELDREGIERVVCLGDMVQGGPQPVECLELMRERGWPAVLGNADAFVLDPATAAGSHEAVTEPMLEARAWSRHRLTDEQAGAIAAWPLSLRIDLGHERSLVAFHATPSSYEPLLLPGSPEAEFRALLGPVDADVAAGGHTHLQFVRRVGATTFVNPGSIGYGYEHGQDEEAFAVDSWASYAVLTTAAAGIRIELRRVGFDGLAVAASLRESGVPHGDARARMFERGASGARRERIGPWTARPSPG